MTRSNPIARALASGPFRRGLAVAWTALIVVLCLLPKAMLPRPETGGPKMLPHSDKVIHSGLFLGFGVLWMWAGTTTPRRRVAVLAGGVLLAAATELLQAIPVVERDPNLLDGLADGAGLVLGVVLSALFPARWNLPESHRLPTLPPDSFQPETSEAR